MRAIIVAAGQGSRLWPVTQRMPKTLLPFREGTILSRILLNLSRAGISEFTIVIGFKGEMIAEYLRSHEDLGLKIDLIENREWARGNGLSVAAARRAVDFGPSILSMSDHLVHPDALGHLVSAPAGFNLLLTDPRVEGIYDLEDATKVRLEENRILEIGKDLTSFNAVDCGIFRIDARFMDALDTQIAGGKESISDGVQFLLRESGFGSVTIPSGCSWIDIDTPDAYEFAIGAGDRFATPALPAAATQNSTEPR